MSDATTEPRVGYRVEVQPRMSGRVQVLVHQFAREGTPGWFSSEREALHDAAKRMKFLAYELMREADCLTRDERGI